MQRTILIVDGEPVWLKVLSRLFRYHGYSVLTAPSCARGLDVLRKNQVDCALLEFDLGDGTGGDICAAIRERDCGIKTPVVILTSDPCAETCLSGPHRAHRVVFKDTSVLELPGLVASLF